MNPTEAPKVCKCPHHKAMPVAVVLSRMTELPAPRLPRDHFVVRRGPGRGEDAVTGRLKLPPTVIVGV